MKNSYSPIRESSLEGSAAEAYYENDAVSPSSWCGCFGGGENRESWFGGKLKKLKEFSEVVAGPKWKNLVRKIGKYCNPRRGKTTAFQYDAESYALNFADGLEEDGDGEDDGLLRNFSSRFAAPAQRVGGLS